jgi:poly(3-hydroxybutyrate) depolymerase
LATLAPVGACPQFQQGLLTFSPSTGPREVEVLMTNEAMTKNGPLVFGWHATGGDPNQAIGWFGAEQIAELNAMGGILIAPYREPNASTRPWYYTPEGPGDADNDMLLMDEIVACAIQSVGIDQRRIHAYGMSAGGLMTVQVGYRRSSYVASVVVYSGGQVGDVPNQDPTNKFAAMVVHGGATDVSSVDGITYQPASETYVTNLKAAGHFAFLCNHNSGHTDPAVLAQADTAHASAWQFLQEHPFGAASPYAAALPQGFWADCTLE